MTKRTREEMAEVEERETVTVWVVWLLDRHGNKKKRLIDNFRLEWVAKGNEGQYKSQHNWNYTMVEKVEMDLEEYRADLRRRMAMMHPDVEGICEKCNKPFWKDEKDEEVVLCKSCRV